PPVPRHEAGRVKETAGARPPTKLATSLGADRFAKPAGRSIKGTRRVPRRILECLGHQPGGQVIATLGKHDLNLAARGAIELGRSTGTGPAPATDPAVLDVEQPLLEKLVEVEGGQISSDADGFGRLLPADGSWPIDDVGVELPPDRLV